MNKRLESTETNNRKEVGEAGPGVGFTGRASKVLVRSDASWLSVENDSVTRLALEQESRKVRETNEIGHRLNDSRKGGCRAGSYQGV